METQTIPTDNSAQPAEVPAQPAAAEATAGVPAPTLYEYNNQIPPAGIPLVDNPSADQPRPYCVRHAGGFITYN